MHRHNLLWKVLDISGMVAGIAAIAIGLLDTLQVVEIIPDKWYPVIAVSLLSALTLYIVLERRLVLGAMKERVDQIGERYTVEILSDRRQTYQYAIDAASEGTLSKPVRNVKIYAPLGFGHIDEDKEQWLNTLRELVISRRVTDVEAIYGIPEDRISLAKAANFMMQFFYHIDDNEENAKTLRDHMFIRGIPLGGAGLGIPRGFGLIIVEDRLLMIGYALSRGDKQVQDALVIRYKLAIKDMSDWFDNHVYGGGGLKVLQEYRAEKSIILRDQLEQILRTQRISEDRIDTILQNKVLGYDEIKAMGI